MDAVTLTMPDGTIVTLTDRTDAQQLAYELATDAVGRTSADCSEGEVLYADNGPDGALDAWCADLGDMSPAAQELWGPAPARIDIVAAPTVPAPDAVVAAAPAPAPVPMLPHTGTDAVGTAMLGATVLIVGSLARLVAYLLR